MIMRRIAKIVLLSIRIHRPSPGSLLKFLPPPSETPTKHPAVSPGNIPGPRCFRIDTQYCVDKRGGAYVCLFAKTGIIVVTTETNIILLNYIIEDA